MLVMRSACASVLPITRSGLIMGVSLPPTRSRELGEFLRLLRERTPPEQVGLEAGGRRRTPGLRREELVQLAGVGLSWYTWLEQGRDITPPRACSTRSRASSPSPPPSGSTCSTSPRSPSRRPPTRTRRRRRQSWRSGSRRSEPLPGYLLNPRTDVLAWNAGAARVIGQPEAAPDGTRNLLWWLFTRPDWRSPLIEQTARYTLARFRAAHARRYDDPAFRALIEALLTRSPAFRELWPRHEVSDSQLGTKVRRASAARDAAAAAPAGDPDDPARAAADAVPAGRRRDAPGAHGRG